MRSFRLYHHGLGHANVNFWYVLTGFHCAELRTALESTTVEY